ncbi:NfeD family protein [Mycoplasmopsis felis]|uniref:NfeD family protein n=1 Tax=Mycoplasmopsis felis TaxID=33923 RepID=UPI003A4DFD44
MWIFMIVFWSIIILLFILVEIFTTGIWSGMTSLVAIPSLFICIFTKSNEWWMILIQVLLFIILWIILYYGVYKILKNKIKYGQKLEQMIGIDFQKKYILQKESKEIIFSNEDYGLIIINGKKFRTISYEKQGIIQKNTEVFIKEIKGNIFYIERV